MYIGGKRILAEVPAKLSRNRHFQQRVYNRLLSRWSRQQ